jgi:ABC-2 type transport system ATP-binding protein
MLMTFTINAHHLRRTFGSKVAVDDLNLQISSGEIYGLVGSDGAGKTTTLRLLVGALKPDSGDASICGYSVDRQTEDVRSQIGYLSQRFSFYEDLTVLENIRFFAEVRGLSRKEWFPRCMEILEFVGLESFKNRRASQLSGGMRQKLGLASALVTRPKVLLLDEPTTGVDPVTRQDFWQLLFQLVLIPPSDGKGDNIGVSVILSTPYMDEAARCHRVGFMSFGQMIAEGTPTQLRSQLEGRIVEVSGRSLSTLRQVVKNVRNVEDIRSFGDRLHLRVVPGKAESVMSNLSEAIHSDSGERLMVRIIPPSLEDIFIMLSRKVD